jgi:hypothetical protein
MDVMSERCAFLDVHRDTAVACVRTPDGPSGRAKQTRTFGTMTGQLLALHDWLAEQRVTVVGMESTGIYWKPVVRHEALCSERSGMTAACLSQQAGEAEGSLTRDVPGRVGAALPTPGRAGTARPVRVRQARREGVRVQEPVVEPPQGQNRLHLADMGRAAVHVHQQVDDFVDASIGVGAKPHRRLAA